MSLEEYAATNGFDLEELVASVEDQEGEAVEEEDHECGPECQNLYSDQTIDALAHDIAQAVLGKQIEREEWELTENFPNAQGFRRAARYVLGSVMGLDHDKEGGHKPGEEDCPECARIESFCGLADDGKIMAPSDGFPNGANVDEIMKRDKVPDKISIKATVPEEIPEGAAFSFKVKYGTDPVNMKHVGWITERGLILMDGVEMSESQRLALEESAFNSIGQQKRDGSDIDIRRLTED